MTEALRAKVSIADYLQGELNAGVKHQLVDGEIYAMAGASEAHNTITLNLAADLRFKLKGSSCKPFMADMKVHTCGDIYYPDIMVVCQQHDDDTEYVKNAPTLIVEVLSKSTRAFDHSTKQTKYLQIPSLEYYVLIEQDYCEVSVLSRAEGFIPQYYYLGQEIHFPVLDLTVTVNDIYDGIENEDMQTYLQSL